MKKSTGYFGKAVIDALNNRNKIKRPPNNTVEDRQPKCCKDMKPIKLANQTCPICGRHVPAAT